MQPSYRHYRWEEDPITNVITFDRQVINCKTNASNHAAGKAEHLLSLIHWIHEWIGSNPDKFYPEPKLAHVSGSHPRLASCRKRIVKPAKGEESKVKNRKTLDIIRRSLATVCSRPCAMHQAGTQTERSYLVAAFDTFANICLGLNKFESLIILIPDLCPPLHLWPTWAQLSFSRVLPALKPAFICQHTFKMVWWYKSMTSS